MFKKLLYSLAHPRCWRGLCLGVAPTTEHLATLRSLSVDGVIDVGANRGQFSLACGEALPGIPVVAFEPNPGEARVYRAVHGKRDCVLKEVALGECVGDAELHISGRADSSSLLPIGESQVRVFPGTAEVGVLPVKVARLDDFADSWAGRRRQLLKIDVQGYEYPVLKGAVSTLASCQYVYVECSEVGFYEGQVLRVHIAEFLDHRGFQVSAQVNPIHDGGKVVQADYLFVRK